MPNHGFKWAAPALLLLLVLLAACGRLAFKGTPVEPAKPIPDLVLTNAQGESVHLRDFEGNVVLLFFGYTHCPDVCPTTLATWKHVAEQLGEDAARVRFVFITVDPERDTPQRLQEHVSLFNPSFIGLTGSEDQLNAAYQFFGIFHQKEEAPNSAAGYLVSHTASTFALDKKGNWRLRWSFGTPAEDIVHDVRQLLRER